MRDKTAPENRVRAAIKDFDTAVRKQLSTGDLDEASVGYQLAIVGGLYNLEVDRAVCLEPAARIVDYFCDWATRARGVLDWSMVAELHNEFVAAAVLTEKTDQLFKVFGKVRWETSPPDVDRFDMDLVCRAFGGRAPEPDRVPSKLLKPPSWLPPMIPMLDAMIAKDAVQFGPALVTFLTKSWGPAAERGAKELLASHWPLYTGKWSLLSAAACRRMGIIPDLPKKAEQYFPRELV